MGMYEDLRYWVKVFSGSPNMLSFDIYVGACIANNNHKGINFAVIIIYKVMDTVKK